MGIAIRSVLPQTREVGGQLIVLQRGWRTIRIVRTGLAKRRLRGKVLASAPWTLWLELSQGLGHLLGYALGPGGSPRHLR
jgi:hypothetical protein